MSDTTAAVTALVQARRRLLAEAETTQKRIEETTGRLAADQQRKKDLQADAASIRLTLVALGATQDEIDYSGTTVPKPMEVD